MKFTFEETELINSFENIYNNIEFVSSLNQAILNTQDTELIDICSSVLLKISNIKENLFDKLPLDIYTEYK